MRHWGLGLWVWGFGLFEGSQGSSYKGFVCAGSGFDQAVLPLLSHEESNLLNPEPLAIKSYTLNPETQTV